jgi:Uma2 family endonuclease
MSTPARRLDLIAVDHYLALDDAAEDAHLEYAAGHVFALAGATRRHAAIAANLTALLHAALEETGCQVYTADLRLRVALDMYFYPDLMVACGERAGSDRDETAPTLLVEILSESTEHRDLGIKLAAYRAIASLRGYLVVSQDERRIEVHRRRHEDAGWEHEVARGAGTVRQEVLGGLDLPLDRIYARTGV